MPSSTPYSVRVVDRLERPHHTYGRLLPAETLPHGRRLAADTVARDQQSIADPETRRRNLLPTIHKQNRANSRYRTTRVRAVIANGILKHGGLRSGGDRGSSSVAAGTGIVNSRARWNRKRGRSSNHRSSACPAASRRAQQPSDHHAPDHFRRVSWLTTLPMIIVSIAAAFWNATSWTWKWSPSSAGSDGHGTPHVRQPFDQLLSLLRNRSEVPSPAGLDGSIVLLSPRQVPRLARRQQQRHRLRGLVDRPTLLLDLLPEAQPASPTNSCWTRTTFAKRNSSFLSLNTVAGMGGMGSSKRPRSDSAETTQTCNYGEEPIGDTQI